MARSRCGTFLVANYYPAGNCGGVESYRRNVLGLMTPYNFRPRDAVEQRLLGHFLRIAQEKARRHLTGHAAKVPRRTLFEILWHMGERLLAEAMLAAKTDADGCIVASEFMAVCCTFRHSDQTSLKGLEKRLSRVAGIVTVDESGDCKLDCHELGSYLSNVTGRRWARTEIQHLLDEFDADGDGNISYQELLALHDSGLVERPGASALIEHWDAEAERLFEGIPLPALIGKVRCHVVHGQTARVLKAENSVVVKLIPKDPDGDAQLQMIRGEWSTHRSPTEDVACGSEPKAHCRPAASGALAALEPAPRSRRAPKPTLTPITKPARVSSLPSRERRRPRRDRVKSRERAVSKPSRRWAPLQARG